MSDQLKNKSGSPFDPYNFSEIKKIQLEIERDLDALSSYDTLEPLDITPKSDSFDEEIYQNQDTEAWMGWDYTPELPEQLDAAEDVPDSIYSAPPFQHNQYSTQTDTPENFYTEVIKQVPPARNQVLSKRLIVCLLLFCTLGTGSLGLGIGFGISRYQEPGIESIPQVYDGNTSEDTAAYQAATGNSRVIFGTDGTGTAQVGSLADVVELVDPSVVRISTNTTQRSNVNPFFGDFNPARNPGGSGIIFAADSERIFIVTSHHVTRGADDVQVSIMERDAVAARPVGSHTATDLTVISVSVADLQRVGIDITDISIASFGNSDNMRVGDVVLAIGNAMGEGNSTTSGIISAEEREIEIRGRSFKVLQTDAAINPGSSGGPLVNKQGQVIGINSFIISTDHYAIEGVGFSIPTNVAMPAIEEIMNASPRPFLGIFGHDVSEEMAAQLNIPPMGVFIDRVIMGSSAYNAGIVRTDIITSFNGRAVFDMDQLVEEIRRRNIGDTVEITILRDGQEQMTLQATLGSDNNDTF